MIFSIEVLFGGLRTLTEGAKKQTKELSAIVYKVLANKYIIDSLM